MENPIGELMQTTLENIRGMVDVDTVVGQPLSAGDGSTIVPISKVCFGFVAGGGEYTLDSRAALPSVPFAGGSGAGVSVQPMGFLVISSGTVRLLSAQSTCTMDKLVELLPQVMKDVKDMSKKDKSGTSEGALQ